jgi:putative endopeptidase
MKWFLLCTAAMMSVASSVLAQDQAVQPVSIVHYGAWGVDLMSGDKSVNPGDDFYRYAEGAWFDKAVIPPDQASTGSGYDVENRAEKQLRAIIEHAAKAPDTSTAKQIGALYNAFLDDDSRRFRMPCRR